MVEKTCHNCGRIIARKNVDSKQRDSREHRALSFPVLLTIALQNLVDQTIPFCLDRQIARPFRMGIIRVENGVAAVLLSLQLFVVVSTLLRIDKRVVSL